MVNVWSVWSTHRLPLGSMTQPKRGRLINLKNEVNRRLAFIIAVSKCCIHIIVYLGTAVGE